MTRQGPLRDLKVVEFAGIGPVPFCGMLLSDMGDDIVRVDRSNTRPAIVENPTDILARGKRFVELDLKSQSDRELALRLIATADVLIEGFRPGVMERLGLGPDQAFARNQRIVYGRMTGWGQTGPLNQSPGHDINYIALTGALHAMGRPGSPPPPPLNLVGDFGGGALYLAMGVCAALHEVNRSGKGQIVDCSMVEGASSLMSMFYGLKAAKYWTDDRDANLIDGGAPFYDTYECKDGKWIAVGAIEPQFYAHLLDALGLSEDGEFKRQMDRSRWPTLSLRLTAIFRTKTRQEWCELLEGTDSCIAPVLSLSEAPSHPHSVAREIFVKVDGTTQPNVAPRFSRTPSNIQGPAPVSKLSIQTAIDAWSSG